QPGERHVVPNDYGVEVGQRVGRPADVSTHTAEVDRLGLVTKQGGSPHQVADVPAVAACQESYPQERPPHPAAPGRVARVTGERCDGAGWQRGSIVYFHTDQASCKKGLRWLRWGPLEVDALEEGMARATTGAGRRLPRTVHQVGNGGRGRGGRSAD